MTQPFSPCFTSFMLKHILKSAKSRASSCSGPLRYPMCGTIGPDKKLLILYVIQHAMTYSNFQSDPEMSKFTVIPEKIMKKVQQVLQPGEELEFTLRAIGGSHTEGGNVAGGFRHPARGDEGEQIGHPWFIITSRRLLLASTGLLSFESRSLTWDQLNSIELQQGLIEDHVIINGMSIAENWTFWKKLRAATLEAVQLAQRKIDESRNRAVAPPQVPASDPINELKMRYVRGEITEEQYNKMLDMLKRT